MGIEHRAAMLQVLELKLIIRTRNVNCHTYITHTDTEQRRIYFELVDIRERKFQRSIL